MSGAPTKKRLLILGGGLAGAHLAARIKGRLQLQDNLDIGIVDYNNASVWHGLLPQVISGLVQAQYTLAPLRRAVHGVTHYNNMIERIDLPNRRVFVSRGDERAQMILEYDYLALILGSVTDVNRFPGIVEHGFQTKTIGDAMHLRNHLIDMLEQASMEPDPAERRRMLTFVVAGAGFAGVEIGGQSNEFIRSILRFYPSIQPSEIRFVLLSNSPRILPALSEELAARTMRFLEAQGVEFRTGISIASATAATAILTTGERIPTRTVIVTVGIGTNPVVADLPVDFVHGRIACDQYCRVLDWPGVYAVGDNAAIPDLQRGGFYPPTGIAAFGGATSAADNILADLRGQRPHECRILPFEALLPTKGYCLMQFGGLKLDGPAAGVFLRLVWLVNMHTWQHRTMLASDWILRAIFPRDISQLPLSRTDTIVPMRFAPGEVIIREGDPGSRFYIITEGEVEVIRELPDGPEEAVARLGSGQHFGEIALIYGVTRTATIRALVETQVLSLARQDFNALVKHLPALRDAFDSHLRKIGGVPEREGSGTP